MCIADFVARCVGRGDVDIVATSHAVFSDGKVHMHPDNFLEQIFSVWSSRSALYIELLLVASWLLLVVVVGVQLLVHIITIL